MSQPVAQTWNRYSMLGLYPCNLSRRVSGFEVFYRYDRRRTVNGYNKRRVRRNSGRLVRIHCNVVRVGSEIADLIQLGGRNRGQATSAWH